MKIKMILFIVLFMFNRPLAYAQELLPVDNITAKVGSYAIYKSDIETAVNSLLSQQNVNVKNVRCQVFDNLVMQKILLIKAEQDSVIVTSPEVESVLERKFDYYISQFGSEEKLEEFYGKTIGQFKEELRQLEKEQMTIDRMKGVITEKITVTPKEVKQFFKKVPRDSLPFFSKEVAVAEIVIEPKVNLDEDIKAKNKLKGIREEILDGKDFEEMAKKYSDEPMAKRSGGDLGMQPRGVMDPKFEAAALSLKLNAISKPFRTTFGWHIVQLLERNGNLYHSRHILIMPKITSKDKELARYRMDSVFNLIKKDSISFVNAAKKVSDSKSTSSNGGFYMSRSGELNISAKELDPSIFFAVDTMKVKEYSRIHQFTKPDGKIAYRVLYLDKKIDAHLANLDDDYEKLYQAKINEKKDKIIQRWYKDAVKNVYIDVGDEFKNCDLKY